MVKIKIIHTKSINKYLSYRRNYSLYTILDLVYFIGTLLKRCKHFQGSYMIYIMHKSRNMTKLIWQLLKYKIFKSKFVSQSLVYLTNWFPKSSH